MDFGLQKLIRSKIGWGDATESAVPCVSTKQTQRIFEKEATILTDQNAISEEKEVNISAPLPHSTSWSIIGVHKCVTSVCHTFFPFRLFSRPSCTDDSHTPEMLEGDEQVCQITPIPITTHPNVLFAAIFSTIFCIAFPLLFLATCLTFFTFSFWVIFLLTFALAFMLALCFALSLTVFGPQQLPIALVNSFNPFRWLQMVKVFLNNSVYVRQIIFRVHQYAGSLLWNWLPKTFVTK
ncbi:hypothetical protein EG68_08251 [Paragonimus skrjabini miyazakii]|uniref:Uncharacterized protein n=1 Tax=Paragonimus skrjabini miyazakii TaxID=59628 RepID=A0A8S9YJM7_9TREM|nr:hypothetical protein EG68_08251 [Paragonimus skrjabini miyazakii]